MVRIFLMTGMAAFLATALCGCMTTSFAPTAADVQAYAIKSVAISGVAPQAVSELISSDLVSAIRTTLPKPGAQPVQMAVSISGFSGGAVASGYKAGADVTVTLKPVAGARSYRPPPSMKMPPPAMRRALHASLPLQLQRVYAGTSTFPPAPAFRPLPMVLGATMARRRSRLFRSRSRPSRRTPMPMRPRPILRCRMMR